MDKDSPTSKERSVSQNHPRIKHARTASRQVARPIDEEKRRHLQSVFRQVLSFYRKDFVSQLWDTSSFDQCFYKKFNKRSTKEDENALTKFEITSLKKGKKKTSDAQVWIYSPEQYFILIFLHSWSFADNL